MARISGEVYRGWREPLTIVSMFLRSRGTGEAKVLEWEHAADEVDRMVTLPGWQRALAPDHRDLELGVRPVYRPDGQVDRRRTRAVHWERRSAEARSGIAQLDVPIEVPRNWSKLSEAQFRGLAVAAILDGLNHLGVASGVGPPALRSRPRQPPDSAGLSPRERLQAGRHALDLLDTMPPGGALLVAREPMSSTRKKTRERFLENLGANRRQTAEGADGKLAFWTIRRENAS